MPRSRSEWLWPARVSRTSDSPSIHNAAEQYSVEVSNARIFKKAGVTESGLIDFNAGAATPRP
jgi:hypothetical protein